jgi:hypothetical protein
MKKTLTLSLLAIGAIFTHNLSAQEQVPNSGFENWNITPIKDSIDTWIALSGLYFTPETNISRIDDGFSGDAIRLENMYSDYFMENVVASLSLGAGFDLDGVLPYPYSSEVETFNAYLRYSFMPGDIGYVRITLQSGGILLSSTVYPIFGESETWTLTSWDLTGPAATPDKVLIEFFSSGYGGSDAQIGTWLEIDHVSFGNDGPVPAELPNFSFEDWTSVELEEVENWSSLDQLFLNTFGFSNISKSSDATEGDFSLKIATVEENIESYHIFPFISNGIFNEFTEEMTGGTEFSGNPIALKGAYKLNSTLSDFGRVKLKIWGEDGEFTDDLVLVQSGTWTNFSLPIDLDFIPDSVLLVFDGGQEIGADFYLDNVRFIYDNVSVDENADIKIELYPNPTNDLVNILTTSKIETIQIFNAMGELVQVENTTNFSLSKLTNGVYFIQIQTNEGMATQLIVKE